MSGRNQKGLGKFIGISLIVIRIKTCVIIVMIKTDPPLTHPLCQPEEK